MDYIKNENNEYIWDGNKIINTCDEKIININNHNIYLIKDDYVYIFYIKIYKTSKSNIYQLETRNELLLSLYLLNYEQLGYDTYFNRYFYGEVEKCCEFCFNISVKTREIKTSKLPYIRICKKCLTTKQEKNYYINDRSFKSFNNINIEMVKKVNNNLVYFYSV